MFLNYKKSALSKN